MGFRFTGLIGLLVAAARSEKLTKERAIEVLNRLAKGDFRISSDLYLWAYSSI